MPLVWQLMFNRGVLHDNAGEAGQALRCYKDLLRASLEIGDVVSEALACNCIGVTLQMQGAHKVGEALKYHTQHLAAADVPGKFIAHSNIGLAYQVRSAPACLRGALPTTRAALAPHTHRMPRSHVCSWAGQALGEMEEAATNHQQALRYAIRMSSLAGESLACGHLGLVSRQVDLAAAKACTERQLQLARTLRDQHGKGDAFLQLGALAQTSGEWNEAQHYFEQAPCMRSTHAIIHRASRAHMICRAASTVRSARRAAASRVPQTWHGHQPTIAGNGCSLGPAALRYRLATAIFTTPGAPGRRDALGPPRLQHCEVQRWAHAGEHGVRKLHEQLGRLSSPAEECGCTQRATRMAGMLRTRLLLCLLRSSVLYGTVF